ncbi:MAG: SIMPL domain-containing protein [Rickettsiales bacterium]|jgi:uncharacterized protein YggE|nr:SIMPL domain-containing protein [Rickettsiales bacterium]
MKKTLVWAGTVVGAAAFLTLVFNYLEPTHDARVVAVSGECLTSAPKDRTAVTLRVQALDRSAAVSMKQATDKITEITDFLKTQDVKMQTTRFESYEKTEWDREAQKSVALGIETTIAVEVSADKIESVEAVMNKFAGMENVYSENFRMFTSAETLKPILEKCLGTAVENARERAAALAGGDGKKVGKLISVEYGAGGGETVRPSNFLRAAKEVSAMDISTGGGLVSKDTDVSVSVSAVFEIR